MRTSLIIIFGFWMFIALFAEFLANDDPVLFTLNGELHCAACDEWLRASEYKTPKEAKAVWQPLVSYDANSLEPSGFLLLPPLSPGTRGPHLLGTDSQSRDLLAGIIYGSRYALLIAFFTTLFAGLTGTILGVIAGFYGDSKFKTGSFTLGIWLISILYVIYLVSQGLLPTWISIALMIITFLGPFFLIKKRKKGVSLPLDTIVSKLTEILDSLPALFVLLAWIAIVEDWNVIDLSVLIAFFTWPAFARLSRVEVNRLLTGDWIKSLQALKMSDAWIIGRQLLPLIMIPLSVHAAFIGAGAISIEATLSFLGFGLGTETVSWGSLLNEARQYFHAWWLVVFPGLCLFSLLWGLNRWARDLQQKGKSNLSEPKETIL